MKYVVENNNGNFVENLFLFILKNNNSNGQIFDAFPRVIFLL